MSEYKFSRNFLQNSEFKNNQQPIFKQENSIIIATPNKPSHINQESYTIQNNPSTEKICCNCKNSQCIKLYCLCFKNGIFCQDCNCQNCLNSSQNDQRTLVINQIMDKNPEAFETKIKTLPTKTLPGLSFLTNELSSETSNNLKGCNCRYSKCQKKYCAEFSSSFFQHKSSLVASLVFVTAQHPFLYKKKLSK